MLKEGVAHSKNMTNSNRVDLLPVDSYYSSPVDYFGRRDYKYLFSFLSRNQELH